MSAANNVRDRIPVRTCVTIREKYTHYREELRADFHAACGYCGDSDQRVDRSTFHIDHFAPQKTFPSLKLVYGNLVYSCRFCNVSKSDHWVGSDSSVHNDGKRGFIDPCHADYEVHLRRLDDGRIVGATELGSYIVRRLRLSLLRHELLWQSRRMRALRNEADSALSQLEEAGLHGCAEYVKLLKSFRALTLKMEEYELGAVSH